MQDTDHAVPYLPAGGLSRCHRTEGCEKPPGHQACCISPLLLAHTCEPKFVIVLCTAACERKDLIMQGFCSNHKGFRRHEGEEGMGPLHADLGTLAGPMQCRAGSAGEGLLVLEEPDPRGEPITAKRKGRAERGHRPARSRRLPIPGALAHLLPA